MSARAVVYLASVLVVSLAFAFVCAARAQTCSKTDFVNAVEQASKSLVALNRQNKPRFQNKLRQLRLKRKWTHDQFMKEAAIFVRDDKIAVFDETSQKELLDIERLGGEGESARKPDCNLLKELEQHMGILIKIQKNKWQYMFKKLDAALAK